MVKIYADVEKNRLIITLFGFINGELAKKIFETIKTETEKLSPGFDVINDISNFKIGQNGASDVLTNIVNFLISKKVNRVVRVVGSSQTGVIQFASVTKQVKNYNAHFVPTFKDAIEYLES